MEDSIPLAIEEDHNNSASINSISKRRKVEENKANELSSNSTNLSAANNDSSSSPPATGIFSHIPPCPIVLSHLDISKTLKLSSNCLEVAGGRGYSSVRANYGITSGCLYYEVRMKRTDPIRIRSIETEPHCRIGFSQLDLNLNTPAGFDSKSYSVGSKRGEKYHEAVGAAYMQRFANCYGYDDVIGCYIILPPSLLAPGYVPMNTSNDSQQSNSQVTLEINKKLKEDKKKKKKSALEMKLEEEKARQQQMELEANELLNQLANNNNSEANNINFDSLDETQKYIIYNQEQSFYLNSKIIFYRNGINQGVAFEKLWRGAWYPTISLYMGCTVQCNFGPNFWAPPKDILDKLGVKNYNSASNDVEANPVDTSNINWLALAQAGLFPHLNDSKVQLHLNNKHTIHLLQAQQLKAQQQQLQQQQQEAQANSTENNLVIPTDNTTSANANLASSTIANGTTTTSATTQ
jgi:hypothetical protein